jgi:UDP-glucuronate decarboxylase
MRILITGGAGFIGANLTNRLLGLGHEILCVDNFLTGSKENLKPFVSNPRFELLRHDINIPLRVEVDGIFNLACPASPVQYQKNPVQTLTTNVLGSINILELAKSLKVRVLQASTSEIYGDPKISPQAESYWGNVNPTGIRSCYDEGKRAAETLFFDYNRQHGVDIRVARIFNTYGPGMAADDGRVVSNFIMQALTGVQMTVYGDGSQTRSLCYVDDLVDGLIKYYFESDYIGPLNLGNPEPVTMLDLANEIKTLTNSSSQIIFKNLPKDDPTQREPDIGLAREIIGWEPVISRNEGLRKAVEYFKTCC